MTEEAAQVGGRPKVRKVLPGWRGHMDWDGEAGSAITGTTIELPAATRQLRLLLRLSR